MSQAVIQVENLSKQYRLGTAGARPSYNTLRESLTETLSAPFRKRGEKRGDTRFWALKDVNFEVEAGEVIGVIGMNGAGKSTLLKVLSRITEPTEGLVRIRGRLASLLEVGTGFHAELTGRENIYLNGAILGMKREEVQRKFDEIVAFAGVDAFVDTPVKRYSSGMFLRLAFAVAAHLEPEILVVDEVLAVGDLEFQRRCMGRMREVSQGGRTVLLVSHNMAAIESLCARSLLLEGGRVIQFGASTDVIRTYHQRLPGRQGRKVVSLEAVEGRQRWQKIFQSIALVDEEGEPTNYLRLADSLNVKLEVTMPDDADTPMFAIEVEDALGQRLVTIRNPAFGPTTSLTPGRWELTCHVPIFPLAPGDYWIGLAVRVRGQWQDRIERVLQFSVGDTEVAGEGRGCGRGLCFAPSQWSVGAPANLS